MLWGSIPAPAGGKLFSSETVLPRLNVTPVNEVLSRDPRTGCLTASGGASADFTSVIGQYFGGLSASACCPSGASFSPAPIA